MSSTAHRKPALIKAKDIPATVFPETPAARYCRIVSHHDHAENLLFGVYTLGPHEDAGWYGNGIPGLRGYGPADYVYFVLSGQLQVGWADTDGNEGALDAGPEEAVYLAPGYRYAARNVTDYPVRVIYCMTPPLFHEESPVETTVEEL
jgi:hypothetical protein